MKDEQILDDRFGFIVKPLRWRIGEYLIEPVPEHAELARWFRKGSDQQQNFYYPPTAERVNRWGRRLKRSRHAWFLYPIRPSHVIRRVDGGALGTRASFRRGDGAILIHALAFLLRLRCQFEDWFFDGRVPVNPDPICALDQRETAAIVEAMLSLGRVSRKLRQKLPNILFMKARNRSYEWDWERLAFEYFVFDALYALGIEIGTVPLNPRSSTPRHGEKFAHLGDSGLICWKRHEREWGPRIVKARNALVHAALWESERDARADKHNPRADDPRHAVYLGLLNDRLLLTVTNVPCGFRGTSWTLLGPVPLEWKGPSLRPARS